ncbi:MAG: cation diffusion facilitator family transporter [Candidatus Obscuribacterales bacterium]|nr:cation diffusion facilitator family transporter [Candidatus Obscuribacterales bacterium]
MSTSHNHHSHTHGHGSFRQESKSRLLIVLYVTAAYMLAEIVGAYYTKSLGLLADAGHMLSDVGSLILALVAIWFGSRPPNPLKTYGYYRSEILAGLINGVLLVGLSVFILFESYQRLSDPPEVKSLPMLVVAVMGLLVNLVAFKLLHGVSKESVNMKAAYLEVMSDLLATVGVIVAAVIMLATGWYMADPIISGLIGLMILPRTWNLLKECTNVLMEGTPGHIDLVKLRNAMLAVPGVVEMHDIHVWTITSGRDAMSGHVTINREVPAENVLSSITRIAQDEFGINHTTFQVEETECKGTDTCA